MALALNIVYQTHDTPSFLIFALSQPPTPPLQMVHLEEKVNGPPHKFNTVVLMALASSDAFGPISVYRGNFGGASVFAKIGDSNALDVEHRAYKKLEGAGGITPKCYGLFAAGNWSILLTSDAGRMLRSFGELTHEQRFVHPKL